MPEYQGNDLEGSVAGSSGDPSRRDFLKGTLDFGKALAVGGLFAVLTGGCGFHVPIRKVEPNRTLEIAMTNSGDRVRITEEKNVQGEATTIVADYSFDDFDDWGGPHPIGTGSKAPPEPDSVTYTSRKAGETLVAKWKKREINKVERLALSEYTRHRNGSYVNLEVIRFGMGVRVTEEERGQGKKTNVVADYALENRYDLNMGFVPEPVLLRYQEREQDRTLIARWDKMKDRKTKKNTPQLTEYILHENGSHVNLTYDKRGHRPILRKYTGSPDMSKILEKYKDGPGTDIAEMSKIHDTAVLMIKAEMNDFLRKTSTTGKVNLKRAAAASKKGTP